MEPIKEKNKNICIIKYVGYNYAVAEIKKYIYDEQILENFICFRIILDKNNESNYLYDKLLCVKKEKNDFNDINKIILERKDIIDTNFKYIEGNENMDIDDYEWIINMKKKLIEKKEDKIIYDEINKCYRKIIEILSNEEDEDVKKYVDELQKFIVDYEIK